jgi:hypothetical protein
MVDHEVLDRKQLERLARKIAEQKKAGDARQKGSSRVNSKEVKP